MDTLVSFQRTRKFDYALPMRADYEEPSNLKKHRVSTVLTMHTKKDFDEKKILS